MQTEISPYSAMRYRDALTRLALQRANIMHVVDLKRGVFPASHRNANRPPHHIEKSAPPAASRSHDGSCQVRPSQTKPGDANPPGRKDIIMLN
jgi:hypothetical protein